MMPRARPARPRDARAVRCLEEARESAVTWKQFRAQRCGQRWWEHLSSAYEHRCVYCDHAPARTFDHYAPRSRTTRAAVFDWANWRAACGDCNRLKATRKPFDPVRQDPFSGLGYSPDTGKPFIRPGCARAHRVRAEASLAMRLDHEILNDARRRVRHAFLLLLMRYLEGEAPKRDVLDFLRAPTGSRAVLRDMILDHPVFEDGIIVEQALERMPELLRWARRPLER